MPDRAKALFAGIDLDLSKPVVSSASIPVSQSVDNLANPLAESLRVKLNLARAYITIEDYAAAKKSLAQILAMSHSIDPEMMIEAQSLLSELQHRSH